MKHEQTEEAVVHYEVQGPVALVTMQRPEYHNAQNSRMTYALDAAFRRACDDDAVKVIVLRGAGKHFSAGHDIGTPGRDIDQSFERTSLWYDHVGKPAASSSMPASRRCTWACAGAGATCPSRPSPWSRAPAWPAA